MSLGTLRAVRDSFLHFLADNLSYPVRYLRYDKNDPDALYPKVEAVNVSFHVSATDPSAVSFTQVSVHVLSAEENTAEDMRDRVVHLLQAACHTPMLDYAPVQTGGTAVSLGKQLSWDRRISFRPVVNDNYYQHSALLHINFVYPATVQSDFS